MTRLPSHRRILFVTPITPFSNSSGSEQRSALMLAGLSTVGTVDVLQLRPGASDQVRLDDHPDHVNVWRRLRGPVFP